MAKKATGAAPQQEAVVQPDEETRAEPEVPSDAPGLSPQQEAQEAVARAQTRVTDLEKDLTAAKEHLIEAQQQEHTASPQASLVECNAQFRQTANVGIMPLEARVALAQMGGQPAGPMPRGNG